MLCFRKLLVAIKIMDKRGTGGYQDFPSKVFCTTMPKKLSQGNPIVLRSRKIPAAKKIMD